MRCGILIRNLIVRDSRRRGKRMVGKRSLLQFSAIACYHLAAVRFAAFCVMLLISALPAMAQRETPSPEKPASAAPSALDGNWQFTGNRERQLYPLLSMAIHVNGKQIN